MHEVIAADDVEAVEPVDVVAMKAVEADRVAVGVVFSNRPVVAQLN